ncbi:beta-mannosidase isoform X2 [Ischnura elegans]|uniref:beta-mannosidase isoform X2 n=1 Tax=Ischnura elegans TaxID=197161 RepID=UPI001ED87ED2|nr:beta-mannosidase isoform X2 [Ischnura elegans]
MLLFLRIISAFLCVNALQDVALNSDNGVEWVVHNVNKSILIPAKVPGGIYSDLVDAQILKDDVYYKSGDEDYRWVAYESWTYERNFTVPVDWTVENKETLIFHGLDTVAEVILNGVQLSPAVDNMFLRHSLNVKGILKYDGLPNHLVVQFGSPVKTALERSHSWPRVVPDCVPASYHGECHANLIRKTQSSFAWDWGPAFPSSGIWKDVELLTYNVAILRDVTVQTEKTDQYVNNRRIWLAKFVLHLEAVAPHAAVEGVGRVVLFIADAPGGMITGEMKVGPTNANEDGELDVEITLRVSEEIISLWWPNGMGQQTLYQAVASFNTSSSSGFAEESTLKKVNIGFRTVELDESQVGKNGLTFLLKINGYAMFSKGSNWIPPHALPEMTSAVNGREMTKDLLSSAKEVGINMLRVWGGGNYESDYFYDLADKMGILIWHDMMFACSMYPTVASFLDSVKVEVKQQVRRLQHHPSIVIWAGNNENEVALRQNWYGTGANFSSYVKDYALLYNLINTTLLNEAPDAIFLFSSPSNGIAMRDVTGPIADDPQSRYYGDIHYYNYLADGWNPGTYHLCRFASEYGFQSLPSMETLRTAGPAADDWGVNKAFFQRRQHHTGGYQEMIIAIQRHLEMPSNTESEEGMSRYVYLTQVNQAMSLKTETEVYRRGMSIIKDDGDGQFLGATMGALYWQLNDIWQAPSWATLEYGGKWKMAHYYVANFFSNLMVSPWVTDYDELQVYLLSTRPNVEEHVVLDCQLSIKIYQWSDPCLLKKQTITSKLISGVGEPFKTVDPGLKDHYPFSAQVNVSSDGVALFVWLEAQGVRGRFSDNGFLLVAGDEDEICRRSNSVEEQATMCVELQGHPRCSVLHNSVRRFTGQRAGNHSVPANMKSFTRTLTFYFRDKPEDSTLLRQSITVTHLLS